MANKPFDQDARLAEVRAGIPLNREPGPQQIDYDARLRAQYAKTPVRPQPAGDDGARRYRQLVAARDIEARNPPKRK